MSDPLARALAAIDAANAEDPSTLELDGRPVARELVYGQRMSAWLARLAPDASEPLQVAVRAQHLQRWKVARASYPEGRSGYKRWRSDLARMHADLASRIAADAGYDPATCARIGELIQKRGLRTDPETQTLEDVACLVFLEHYLGEFAAKHERAKVIDILRKTWPKMSERGHAAALGLALDDEQRALVADALAAPGAISE
jgi:hypothetical protein